MTDPLHSLLGQRIRVYSAALSPTQLMGEGEVVAICFVPSITIRHDDGTLSHHSSELPRKVLVQEWVDGYPPAEASGPKLLGPPTKCTRCSKPQHFYGPCATCQGASG